MSHSDLFKDLQFPRESKLINIEAEINDLKKENFILKNNEVQIQILDKQLQELTEKNHKLEKQLNRVSSDHYKEITELQLKKEMEVNSMKNYLSKINSRFDTIQLYEHYLQEMEKVNKELTEKVKILEDQIDKDKELARGNYQLKLDQVKHKSLDALEEMRKESHQTALDNNKKNVKIMMLQNKELFE